LVRIEGYNGGTITAGAGSACRVSIGLSPKATISSNASIRAREHELDANKHKGIKGIIRK
jgi:hypothetical protein